MRSLETQASSESADAVVEGAGDRRGDESPRSRTGLNILRQRRPKIVFSAETWVWPSRYCRKDERSRAQRHLSQARSAPGAVISSRATPQERFLGGGQDPSKRK